MSQSGQPMGVQPRKRRKRVRRFLAAFLIALVVVMGLIAIGGQIIFSTDLPKNIVINVLETQFRLRMSAKSLSTGWIGQTTLHDVTLTLPLADKAFVTVPALEVKHTPLLWFLVTRNLNIHAITIAHPQIDVVQDPRGSWNLLEVGQLLIRTGGGSAAAKSAGIKSGDDTPQLPRLTVNGATLVVTDNDKRTATVSNLSVTGTPDGPLVWDYRAAVPNQFDLTGKVSLGGKWGHQINLNVHDIGKLIAPWVLYQADSVRLKARWSGEFDNGQLSGRLDCSEGIYAHSRIVGPVEATIRPDGATFRPAGISYANTLVPDLHASLNDGQILTDGTQINARDLSIALSGGVATLDGKFMLANGAASLRAAWRDVEFPQATTQSGDLTWEYTPSLAQPHFKLGLKSHGTVHNSSWDSEVYVNGAGKSWRTLSLSATAPKLQFNLARGRTVDLSGLVARANSTTDGIALSEFRIGDSNMIVGSGGYTASSRTAWFYMNATGWPAPHLQSRTVDVNLNAWCNPSRVHLIGLYVNSGPWSAFANGEYVYDLPKPVEMHLYYWGLPKPSDPQTQFRGALRGNFDLEGTIKPLQLGIAGNATGTDVYVGSRPLGDVNCAITGSVDRGIVSLYSQDFELMGGNWYLAGHWPVTNSLLRLDKVKVQHLSIATALARKDVKGQLSGEWSIDVHRPELSGIDVSGSADISDFAIGSDRENAVPLFAADEIKLPDISLQSGMINLKSASLKRTTADVSGYAKADLSTTLARPTLLNLNLDAAFWPIQLLNGRALCVAGARGDMNVDLAAQSATGQVEVRADGSLGSESIGRVDAELDLNKRQIKASNVEIQALGGSGWGEGRFDIDRPYQTRCQFEWKDMDLSQLQGFVSAQIAPSGKIRGSLQVNPATVSRALEPLAITTKITSDNVQLAHIKIGDMQANAYLGPDRFVLDDSPDRPTQVAFGGGTVQFWGRVTQHSGDLYQTLLQINLVNLDMDQVLPSKTKVGKAPGLVNGRITVVGQPSNPELTFGEGRLLLSQSNLAGIGPVALLYNTMRLGHDADKPTGFGSIDFSIQREGIAITGSHYFDQGAEIRMGGTIGQLYKLGDAPINMVFAGSARPLKALDIIGVSDIDEALAALQRDATTVHVTGTIYNYKDELILFSNLSHDVQTILASPGSGAEMPSD